MKTSIVISFVYLIKTKLETQFFHLHPSLKRVVEFISESVSTNFVRNYKHITFKDTLNEYKETFITEYFDENQDELDVKY